MAKYLFMYVSGGAGHVGRSLAIANYLREVDDDIAFAGGKVGKGMVTENGFRFIELETPEYFEDNRPTSDIGGLVGTYMKNMGFYRKVILKEDPELIIVDTEPVFVFLSRFLGYRTVFINHEMIPLWIEDIPPVARKIRDFILKKTLKAADRIIFPDIMGVEPDGFEEKCEKVGPLGYTEFERIELKGERRVLIVPSATGDTPPELIEMLKKEDYEIYIRARGNDEENVHYLPRVRNLLSYIDAVDLVICSGYSTIMETASLGKPMVIYPKTEEQRIVGRLCEKNGIALYAERPDEVAEAVKRIFSDESLGKRMVDRQRSYENGAKQAAMLLVRWTEE